MKINDVTIGSDPEYGVIDENGIPVSAVGFLPGTKKKPFALNPHVSCQTDNVGAECCIPPVTNEDDFVMFMQMAKDLTEKKLQEKKPNYRLVSVSSQEYDKKELQSSQAQRFGCEPSYCVYTKNVSPRPSPEEVGNLRSFGFHIHVGFKIPDSHNMFGYAERLIKAMDIMLGAPSIIIDKDEKRRQIYGNAGDFRVRTIKDVLVVEYRTLGAYMHDNAELLRFVYRQTIRAVQLFNSNYLFDIHADSVKKAIDEGNVQLANNICKVYSINIPKQYTLIKIPALTT